MTDLPETIPSQAVAFGVIVRPESAYAIDCEPDQSTVTGLLPLLEDLSLYVFMVDVDIIGSGI
jgi:hypothetical protein